MTRDRGPVLMIAPYPPKRDGIATYTAELVSALRARTDVAVATQRGFGAGTEPDVYPVLDGSPGCVWRLHRLAARLRPEVVHVQFAVPTYGLQGLYVVLALLALRRRCPVVTTLHEVSREVEVLGGAAVLLFRVLGRLSDRVVVHSRAAAATLTGRCRLDPGTVVTLPHGVPAGPAPDATAAAGPRLLYFGFLHPDKGIEHLVQACRLLTVSGVSFRAVIAGAVRPRTGLFRYFERADHRYAARLRAAVRDAGLGDRVTFPGYLPAAALAAELAAARVVVLPYVNATQSGVANRALAAGRPIVASDLPGLRGDLDGAAVFVPPAAPEALAVALALVLRDDALAAQLSAAAAAVRAANGIEVVAGRLLELYRDCEGRRVAC